jgi:hypothetical protein
MYIFKYVHLRNLYVCIHAYCIYCTHTHIHRHTSTYTAHIYTCMRVCVFVCVYIVPAPHVVTEDHGIMYSNSRRFGQNTQRKRVVVQGTVLDVDLGDCFFGMGVKGLSAHEPHICTCKQTHTHTHTHTYLAH